MTTPILLPVITRIRKAVVYSVENRIISGGQTIRYSNSGNNIIDDYGYYMSYPHCYDTPRSYETFSEFPSINLFIDIENSNANANVQIDQNSGMLHNKFSMRFEVFLNCTQDVTTIMDCACADLQRFFGVNYYIPDSSGIATASHCYYTGSERWGVSLGEPVVGITVRFDVWYRQRIIDPTIMS